MENNSLSHWGIKGMKWGVRRYQNKDGSRTPLGKKRYDGDDKEETIEERRSRLLKSTNATEIYNNRHILTTAELNDRINRINTEQRLSDMTIKDRKTGMDRIDNALKVGRKINEVYQFATESAIGKTLGKKLFGKSAISMPKGLEDVWDMKDKLSTKDLQDVLKRTNTEKALKKALDDERAERAKDKTNEDTYKKSKKEYDTAMYKRDHGQVDGSYHIKFGKQKTDNIIETIGPGDYEIIDSKTLNRGRSFVSGFLENNS